MKRKFTIKEYILMGLLISLGMVLQLVDNLMNFTGVPGGKLGLANIVSLANIFIFGGVNALVISVIRAFLGSLIFSSASSVPYAVSGAFFSTVIMTIIKKYYYPKVSEIGISICGAVMHNYAQLMVAAVVFQNIRIFSYASVLTLVSLVAGLFTGFQVKYLNKRIFGKD